MPPTRESPSKPEVTARNSDDSAMAVVLDGVEFSWNEGAAPDLRIRELCIRRGERLLVRGPSGSGKSTLLGLLAGVNVPQKGTITMLEKPINTLPSAERDRFRADHLGYIFQMFNLIPYLTVIENVLLPLRFSERRRMRVDDPSEEARRLLAHLEMEDLLGRPVTKLSVGQQQRVAAARALIGSPEIILADEPTSALDAERGASFLKLLFEECDRTNATLIFVSHDDRLTSSFPRSFSLLDR